MSKADRLSMRQEAFALNVANGEPLTEAYRHAGFTATGNAVAVNATRLMKLAKVRLRVGSLQAKYDAARVRAVGASAIVTAHTVTNMLIEVFEVAKRDKQHGAAATAAMGLAKLHGLLVDKTEDVTRRAARSPDAPLEIDVEHWLTEQGVVIEPSPPTAQGAIEQRSDGHGAPLPIEPLDQGSEPPPLDESGDGSGGDLVDRPLTH